MKRMYIAKKGNDVIEGTSEFMCDYFKLSPSQWLRVLKGSCEIDGYKVKVCAMTPYSNEYMDDYSDKWNKAVQRLRDSGVDLKKIRISTK